MLRVRTVNDIDLDLSRAIARRLLHDDDVSQKGVSITIDSLLDERLALTGTKRGRR